MSEQKDPNKEWQKRYDELEDLERKKQENLENETQLKNKRLKQQLEREKQAEEDLRRLKDAEFGFTSTEEILQIQKDNDDYLIAAKNGYRFINKVFDNVVPFFRKNLLLVAAQTGGGKSTVTANIIYEALIAKSDITGRNLRVLVITNEELKADVLNRVTCLHKGWSYTNHDKFSDDQRQSFNKHIPIWLSGGRLNIIDNNHQGVLGTTTTIEGIRGIFDNLIEKKQYFDIVVIDYYQNINMSSKNPNLSVNEIQQQLSTMLDTYKNIYPAPIVLMSQLKPQTKDEKPFKERIEGRKIILNVVTFAVEMQADPENLRTVWTVHKSRFAESLGKSFNTGYQRGRFVEYNNAFIEGVQKMKYKQQDKEIGMKTDEDEDGNKS